MTEQVDSMVLVSVIIPIYNVEDYIEKCIESVRRQSWRNIEMICVNDGTPDGSMEILEQKALSDDRMHIINIVNSGLSVARNVGMERAKGKYICFLDSDDYLVPNAIEALVKCAEQNTTELLFFGAECVFESEEIAKKQRSYMDYYKRNGSYHQIFTGDELFLRMMNFHDFKPSACMIFINRSFLETSQIRFYPGILHEDNLFTLQLLKKAKRTMLLDQPFYKRLVRAGSITSGGKRIRRSFGLYICHRELLEYVDGIECTEEYQDALREYLGNMQRIAVRNVAALSREDILEEMERAALKDKSGFLEYLCEGKRNAADRSELGLRRLRRRAVKLWKYWKQNGIKAACRLVCAGIKQVGFFRREKEENGNRK